MITIVYHVQEMLSDKNNLCISNMYINYRKRPPPFRHNRGIQSTSVNRYELFSLNLGVANKFIRARQRPTKTLLQG